MADIVLTCPQCGKTATVSEYVALTSMPCPACGTAIQLPKKTPAVTLGLRRQPAPAPAPESQQPVKTVSDVFDSTSLTTRRRSVFLQRDIRRVKRDKWVQRSSWVVFLALSAWLCHLRFNGGWAGLGLASLADLQQYGLLALGLVYILVIICAIRDNMFDGLLAVVVPLYPIYYIFMVSGALFLRAVTAALLAGFGYDAATAAQEWMMKISEIINYWIHNA